VQTSMVRRYSDPSEYMRDLRWAKTEFCVTARGEFSAKHTRIVLPRILSHRFSEELPRIVHINHAPRRALFIFATRPGPSWFTGATEIPPGAILRFRDADQSFQRSTGRLQAASLSISIEDVECLGAALPAGDFKPPQVSSIVKPNLVAMARLQKIHGAAAELVEHAPEVIAVPPAANGLEQALLAAMAECLKAPHDTERRVASHHRDTIMRRFHALLEAHPDGALHALEICKALGVSNRTLTICCHEALGMTPHRYLKLRQLHLAHRALRQADSQTRTVTQVATECGFWDLGRFSAAYRDLFGEPPSDTLRGEIDGAPNAWEPDNFMLGSEFT
jgi:AraC-like DNA-binding protein